MANEMAGEDASLDAITQRILGLAQKDPGAVYGDAEAEDTRPNGMRDPIERQRSGDIDAREEEEPTPDGAAEGADADEAGEKPEGDDNEAYLELPGADGEEAEKIPLAKAQEIIKQHRQMEGDIATAVIRAETEAQQKQDELVSGIRQHYERVAHEAKVTLSALNQMLPQAPNPIMLDRNAGYYDPEGYHIAKLQYDEFMEYRAKVSQTIKDAEKAVGTVSDAQAAEETRRENARLARYIPEWGDDKTRDAKKTAILDALSAKYGITKDEFGDVVSHKAWRMMNDLAESMAKAKAAPEVRKAVQEKAAKIVNGRVSPERAPDGRYMKEARTRLKETGSVDDAAAFLLRSGYLR